ncbi:MAG: DEAD/DEAH box helicase [Nitrosopumilaceae archaeon]|nr:DEAD/DEAH box helicase [Nitrosopumilaceae archaeon]
MGLIENVDVVREIIYELEADLIKNKKFLDEQLKPIFLTNVEIQKNSTLSENEIVECIQHLEKNNKNEFIVFQNLLITDEKNVKFLIRSRIYHTVWCLYKTENRPAMERNVADYQYIRHIKRRPLLNNKIDDIFLDPEIRDIFQWGKSNQKLIVEIIHHLKNTTKFNNMSNFQLDSATNIIKNLNKKDNANGIVLVAGTGSGKSFAYQFPMLLWILNKKINMYEKHLLGKIKKSDLHVNCSALLIFPRKSLARDQNDSIIELIEKINEFISKNILDTKKKEFLKIKKPVTDFGSQVGKLDEVYGTEFDLGYPDIIITNPESLNKRLINPECHPVYRNGIDAILYDEVHMWDTIGGAGIASLNARLQNLFKINSNFPLFIGMSATIDNPDIHCQKLFCLLKNYQKIPVIIQNDNDDNEKFSIEYHLMLKPASGRYVSGVALESTSCLLHNRRDGLSRYHDDSNNGINVIGEEKPKTITFLNSLDGSGRYHHDLNNYESFEWARGNNPPAANRTVTRTYFYYNKPRQGQSGVPHIESCTDCVNRINPDIFDCSYYRNGECWYYSQDDANQFANLRFGNWHPIVPGVRIPLDNIRSTRVTSMEIDPKPSEDKYDYFKMNSWEWVWDGIESHKHNLRTQIDNVIATSTLEVGVDFNNIKEVIQIGQITSPSSYKQRAGRGAREGNLDDGLFVMSIIDESPLSYYHFKHFKRLVTSTLDPLKLEITNPNVVLANGFLSIFDFLAFNGINLFRIRFGPDKFLLKSQLDENYDKAISLLSSNKTKFFIKNFLDTVGFFDSSNESEKIINDAIDFLKELSTKHMIKIHDKTSTYTLHEWFVRAAEDNVVFRELGEQLELDIGRKKTEEIEKVLGSAEKLKEKYNHFFPDDDLIHKKIDELRGELFG